MLYMTIQNQVLWTRYLLLFLYLCSFLKNDEIMKVKIGRPTHLLYSCKDIDPGLLCPDIALGISSPTWVLNSVILQGHNYEY